jgi:hypothetical protein
MNMCSNNRELCETGTGRIQMPGNLNFQILKALKQIDIQIWVVLIIPGIKNTTTQPEILCNSSIYTFHGIRALHIILKPCHVKYLVTYLVIINNKGCIVPREVS